MSQRPYITLRITQLRELADQYRTDKARLGLLAHELSFRKTAAARQLLDRIEKNLSSFSVNTGEQPMNTEVTSFEPELDEVEETTSSPESFLASADPFVLQSLDLMRKKLLDLTARNRLLNFPVQQKSSGLRLIDEVPNQLADVLLNDKELKFRAVPSPTYKQLIEHGYLEVDLKTGEERKLKPDPDAREWAKVLGLDVSYELPREEESEGDSKHKDDSIQVLLYPAEMESHLRGIRNKAQTAIEESGTSILYLTLGFLEWTEREDSSKSRLAPLYTIPVHLNRGRLDKESGTYQYTLSYTGEDIFPNLSLREKLSGDFSLALPDLEDDEAPESYMDRVAALIAEKQPKWSVKRYGGLTLLNFSKMLMYLDLDPERWPNDQRNLVKHPIVERFFKSSVQSEAAGSGGIDEHRIDELDDVHDLFPLIDDADSSQHSALIDAVNGKNLVIEGPPGTGKSQTITNLIAAAMLNGKKVLFVAEKMAALEVVKSRLDRAGLGGFCLELHSHKSQKRKVLEDIDARVKMQVKRPSSIETDIQIYEEKKEQLNRYAAEINETWANTGLTIHEIFAGASRYRQQLRLDPSRLHIDGLSGVALTEVDRRRLADQVMKFQQVYHAMVQQLGHECLITDHPWSGVENTGIQLFDAGKVVEVLNQWQLSLDELLQQLKTTAGTLGCDYLGISTFSGCEALARDAEKLPVLTGLEVFQALAQLDENTLEEAESALSLYDQVQEQYSDLSSVIVSDALAGFARAPQVPDLPDLQQKTGAVGDESLAVLIRCTQKLQKIEQDLEPLMEQLSEVIAALPDSLANHLGGSASGLKAACRLFELIDSLDSHLISRRADLFDDDELDDVLDDLDTRLERLRSLRASVSSQLRLEDLPDVQQLKTLLSQIRRTGLGKWFAGDWWKARKQIKALAVSADGKVVDSESVLVAAIDYLQGLDSLDEESCKKALGSYYEGLETDVSLLKQIRAWVARVRGEYGVGFVKTAPLGDALMSLESRLFKAIKQLESTGFSKKLRVSLDDFEAVQKVTPIMPAGVSPGASLSGENGLLLQKCNYLKDVLTPVQSWIKEESLTVAGIQERVSQLSGLAELQGRFTSNTVLVRLFGSIGELSIGPDVTNTSRLQSIRSTMVLASHIHKELCSIAVKQALLEVRSSGEVEAIKESVTLGVRAFQKQQVKLEQFTAEVELSRAQWLPGEDWDIERLLKRNQSAIDKPEWLNDWVNFIRIRNDMKQRGLEPLWRLVTSGELGVEQAIQALDMAIFDQLSREVLEQRSHLAMISGKSQRAIQKTFRDYDQKLKELQRDRIASVLVDRHAPAGNSGGRKSEYTEMALIKNELGKKTRHIPIRQLVNRASNALVALKPCFMMGPMSAAQYLQPGNLQFDLVVMDEASQVKPEDALGVIARGAQLVVVGDPKQLPPTSFFDRQDSEDEEDNAAVIQTDSILDASLPLFEMRRLRWHYRSQHESLIAFSNRNFYDNDLVIFPSPHSKSPDFGVKFTYVRGARFVNQHNIEEARTLAKAVVEHARHRPDESLGVVAMSSKQRDQIERSVEELCKNDSGISDAIDRLRNREDGLFIKNLENVQGDERDVIFISCTYGPGEVGGKVYQRFGPINSDIGWRRLNVLFTRSKKRMHVFSSMRAEDVVLSESSKRGVVALRNFLHFAEKGNMDGSPVHTGKAPDSDFEVAVIEALYQAGFECDAQVGVAGFFVDIAVKDPGNPGRYLMAIECDGATYHSAKSARDRDRLRQEILERLGWEIRRIWSTDWFTNPVGELEPIIRDLHEKKSVRADAVVEEDVVEPVEAPVPEVSFKQEAVEQASSLSLRERLEEFGSRIISVRFPDTAKERRLLRPAMIEALVEHEPSSITDFVELIPEYLRKSTEAAEAKEYLSQVLDIIAGYEVEDGAA